jgi:hypothetical protein
MAVATTSEYKPVALHMAAVCAISLHAHTRARMTDVSFNPEGLWLSSVPEPLVVPAEQPVPPQPYVNPGVLQDGVNRVDQARMLRDIVEAVDPSRIALDRIHSLQDVTERIQKQLGIEPQVVFIALREGMTRTPGWLSSAWEALKGQVQQLIPDLTGPFYKELLRDLPPSGDNRGATYMTPLATALLPFSWAHSGEVDGLRGIQDAYARVNYHSARILVILRIAYPNKVNMMDYTYELEQLENQKLDTQTIIAAMTMAMDRTMSADRGLGLTDSRDFFGMYPLSRHIAAFQYSLSELTSLVAQMDMQSGQQRKQITPAGYNMLLTLDLVRSKMYNLWTEVAQLRNAGYIDGISYLARDQTVLHEYEPDLAETRFQLMTTQLRAGMLSLAFDGRLQMLRETPENMQLLGEIDQLSRVFDRTWKVYQADTAHAAMDRVLPFAVSDYPGLYTQAVRQYSVATNTAGRSLQDDVSALSSQNGTQSVGRTLGLRQEDIKLLDKYDTVVRSLMSQVIGLANEASEYKNGNEHKEVSIGNTSLRRVLEMCASEAVERELRYYDTDAWSMRSTSPWSKITSVFEQREIPKMRFMLIHYRDACLGLTKRYDVLQNGLIASWGAHMENEAMQFTGNPDLQKIYIREGVLWAQRFNEVVEQRPLQVIGFLQDLVTITFSADTHTVGMARDAQTVEMAWGNYNVLRALGRDGVDHLVNSVKECVLEYMRSMWSVLESHLIWYGLRTSTERDAAREVLAGARDVLVWVVGSAAGVASALWTASQLLPRRRAADREVVGILKNSHGNKPVSLEVTSKSLLPYIRDSDKPVGSGVGRSSWWNGTVDAFRRWCWYNPKTDTVETGYADFQGTLGLFAGGIVADPQSIWHPSKAKVRAKMDEVDGLSLLMLVYASASF